MASQGLPVGPPWGLLMPGVALELGSLAGVFAGVAGMAVFLPIRIAVEEGFLSKSLP